MKLEVKRRLSTKTENYVEEVVLLYNLSDFHSHFRMTKSMLQKLLESIGRRITIVPRVATEKKLLFTVWILVKPESFRSSCDRFGFSKDNGHLFYNEIVRLIYAMVSDEICWPNYGEARATSTFFLEKHGFPGIIGAIDGCHIPIKAPANNPTDYYNRNSYIHSFNIVTTSL